MPDADGVLVAEDNSVYLDLVTNICNISGIERVETTPHSLFVTRALLCDWTLILDQVLDCARMALEQEHPGYENVEFVFITPEALSAWNNDCHTQYACWAAHGCGVIPQPAPEEGEESETLQ